MTLLDQLIALSAMTVIVTLIAGRYSFTGWLSTLMYAGQGVLLWKMSALGYAAAAVVDSSFTLQILNQSLHWRFDALSWFFAIITVGAGLCSSWFMSGEWGRSYQKSSGKLGLLRFALAFNVFSMLVLLASGELLSMFIGWELVSWASFLIMAMGSARAARYAMRYLIYAIAGAMAILGAMVLVYSTTGSFEFDAFKAAVPAMSTSMLWLLFGLFATGFGIKMALLPFHLWQAKAYAETPGPGAAFLGAISSRMGLFALILVLVQLVGMSQLAKMEVPFTFLSARDLLAWIAVFTIIIPTYTALQQHDARRLLAWHGVGQTGYMLLGIVIVVPVIFVERMLMTMIPQSSKVAAAAYHAFVVAGSTEELFKFLVLYLLVWKNPNFNEKFDGIVYAVFVSLGFAGVENVLYVMDGGMQTALTRAITAVPAHAIFGITMGYYLGIAHMYKELKGKYLARALLVPILLHGIYDFILMVEIGWLLLLFVPYVIVLYIMGMKKMKVLSDTSIFKPMEAED